MTDIAGVPPGMTAGRIATRATLSAKMFVTGMSLLFAWGIYHGFSYVPITPDIALDDEIVDINAYADTTLRHIAFYVLFLSLVTAIYEGAVRKLRRKYQWWIYILGFQFVFLFFLWFVNGNYRNGLYFTATDIFAMTLFSGLLVAGNPRNSKLIEWMLIAHFVIGTLVLLIGFGMFVLRRTEDIVFSSVYRFWALLYAWPYFLLTFRGRSTAMSLVIAVGISMHVLIAFMVLKRMIIVSIVLYVLIGLFGTMFMKGDRSFLRRRFGRWKVIIPAGAILIAAIVGLEFAGVKGFDYDPKSAIGVEAIEKRLFHVDRELPSASLIETISRNYRWAHEGYMVLGAASWPEIVLGRGIGATIPVPRFVSPGEEIGILHSGMLTFVLKGGILFLALWYLGSFFVTAEFFRSRRTDFLPYYGVVIVYIFISFGQAVFIDTLGFGMLTIALGKTMSKMSRWPPLPRPPPAGYATQMALARWPK